jgi:hydroxymethylbilane synthase
MKTIRIGTRGSLLALAQTRLVEDLLRVQYPGISLERVVIHSGADNRPNIPLTQFRSRGVFVKELEEALLEGRIDLAVHSLKDLPSELPKGLILTVTPERADPSDALISKGKTLEELQSGAIVGTGSPRRQAFLRSVRPDLVPVDIRGNLDTRLKKLETGSYHALILASAGLHRLGLSQRITQRLSLETFIPAPGQGALALETRTEDRDLHNILKPLNHLESAQSVLAERSFQAELKVGCSVPVGAFAFIREDALILEAAIASPDGEVIFRTSEHGDRQSAVQIGIRAARSLRAKGADILRSEP